MILLPAAVFPAARQKAHETPMEIAVVENLLAVEKSAAVIGLAAHFGVFPEQFIQQRIGGNVFSRRQSVHIKAETDFLRLASQLFDFVLQLRPIADIIIQVLPFFFDPELFFQQGDPVGTSGIFRRLGQFPFFRGSLLDQPVDFFPETITALTDSDGIGKIFTQLSLAQLSHPYMTTGKTE